MKKIILAALVLVGTLALGSCGKHMYRTGSSGKDNVSMIVVIKEPGVRVENVVVEVDGTPYTYGKVYKVKMKRKAHPVYVEPGKHHLKVIVDGRTEVDEQVFLGLQETKVITLRE